MTLSYPHFKADDTLPVANSSEIAPPRGFYRNFPKRAFDVAAILLTAPFVLPLVLLLAFFVSRDGNGAFYTQLRVGRDGRSFRMLKLRSMVPDADRLLEEHLAADPAARAEWNTTQKLRCDPRITPVGRFLRKSSLDELPQLWNVLTGDMSLVGPRPMLPDQRARYPGTAYYKLRPGLTGPWQVHGRNDTTFEARATYDADYHGAISLRGDLTILAQTVGVVLRGTGC